MFKRKYSLNEKIFEEIKTEEQAYWLGFFTADGTITENKIRLSLAEKDYSHLLLWKQFTDWGGKDYYHKDAKAWEVYFRSTKIKNDLALFSVTPHKTFTVRFPYGILKEELTHHYVRGVFDADGYITVQIRKSVKPNGKVYQYYGGEFSIEGNLEFATALQNSVFINKLHLPKASLNYSHTNISRIRYGRIDQLATIYHYLYDGSSVHLQRKKTIFEKILLHRERLNEWTPLKKVKQQSELYGNIQNTGEIQYRSINVESQK